MTQFVSNESTLTFRKEILDDYKLARVSRIMADYCRREVLSGKAKFGIGGEGKELAQIALAKAFKKGDFRAGYYRDQTIMLALGLMTIEDYFAQLYADAENDPFSSGRQMVCHYASPFLDANGDFLDLRKEYNITSDISSTAGQVARAMGLAMASKKFRNVEELKNHPLNCGGTAVTFLTIGDGSTSEGPFLELVNAAAVTRVPLAMSVWDDGYAISVPTKLQTTKESISRALEGFLLDEQGRGIRIYTAKGWDYPGLCEMYMTGIPKIREEHIPALFHVQDITQPLGHSTSGSHQRYKNKKRLAFEKEMDCLVHMKKWIVDSGLATEEELNRMDKNAKQEVVEAKNAAWQTYKKTWATSRKRMNDLIDKVQAKAPREGLIKLKSDIASEEIINIAEVFHKAARFYYQQEDKEKFEGWIEWFAEVQRDLNLKYSDHLLAEGVKSYERIKEVAPSYDDDAPVVNGSELLNRNFDVLLSNQAEIMVFGEDVGMLGDVNQGMVGMQKKYGKERVFDTGIREWTIVGAAIGMAMRGLRPIAEIQYVDYIAYALAPLLDDLASLRYRSAGMQKAPCIIRTRGHRLEGIWHTGSPMGMLTSALRGMHICVPRNMTQAAGMYNTALQIDDPVVIVECLNAYRKKERVPSNLGSYTVEFGKVEKLRVGADMTVVSYGACIPVCLEAAEYLSPYGIELEVIDIRTLLPLDRYGDAAASVRKTNKLLVVDEDVPSSASAYIMNTILERDGAFDHLEIPATTLTAAHHRTPYGDNGELASKPHFVKVINKVFEMMAQLYPQRFIKYTQLGSGQNG